MKHGHWYKVNIIRMREKGSRHIYIQEEEKKIKIKIKKITRANSMTGEEIEELKS